MTPTLLARIEAQAVEIAQLKRERDQLAEQLRTLPAAVRRHTLEELSGVAVNCGSGSYCRLVCRELEVDE